MGWNIVSVYRRLLELETGAVIKDWGGKIPIALAFPNTYHLGMSNLGFQAVYGLLNDLRDVVCERFFLPEPALAAEYARTGTRLLSVESQRPLSDFELAAFSISHENDYPSVLRILRMSGLEVRRPDRTEVDPPILIGGVTARSNPETPGRFYRSGPVGGWRSNTAFVFAGMARDTVRSPPKNRPYVASGPHGAGSIFPGPL